MRAPRTSVAIATLALLLAGISFALAARLTSRPEFARDTAPSAWNQIFGGATSVLSRDLYQVADRYFHKGVGHQQKKAFDDPFQKLEELVSPSEHAHLSSDGGVLEIMPWLSLATKVDPNNIEAYQVASYWLKTAGKLDQAEKVLNDAIADNPDDYRLRIELALLAAARDNRDAAAKQLDLALKLWPQPLDANEDEARLDLGRALQYRALIYQLEGEDAAALPLLERELEIFLGRHGTEAEIEAIRSATVDRQQIEKKWLILQEDKRECSRGHNEHDDHGHDHGD